MMYSSSPISRGRSTGDEGWKGWVQTAKAMRERGRQRVMAPEAKGGEMLSSGRWAAAVGERASRPLSRGEGRRRCRRAGERSEAAQRGRQRGRGQSGVDRGTQGLRGVTAVRAGNGSRRRSAASLATKSRRSPAPVVCRYHAPRRLLPCHPSTRGLGAPQPCRSLTKTQRGALCSRYIVCRCRCKCRCCSLCSGTCTVSSMGHGSGECRVATVY
jgi:hypothetical protein